MAGTPVSEWCNTKSNQCIWIVATGLLRPPRLLQNFHNGLIAAGSCHERPLRFCSLPGCAESSWISLHAIGGDPRPAGRPPLPKDAEFLTGIFKQLSRDGCAVAITCHEVRSLFDTADDILWMTAGTHMRWARLHRSGNMISLFGSTWGSKL